MTATTTIPGSAKNSNHTQVLWRSASANANVMVVISNHVLAPVCMPASLARAVVTRMAQRIAAPPSAVRILERSVTRRIHTGLPAKPRARLGNTTVLIKIHGNATRWMVQVEERWASASQLASPTAPMDHHLHQPPHHQAGTSAVELSSIQRKVKQRLPT